MYLKKAFPYVLNLCNANVTTDGRNLWPRLYSPLGDISKPLFSQICCFLSLISVRVEVQVNNSPNVEKYIRLHGWVKNCTPVITPGIVYITYNVQKFLL
jgi:hypothetical protein